MPKKRFADLCRRRNTVETADGADERGSGSRRSEFRQNNPDADEFGWLGADFDGAEIVVILARHDHQQAGSGGLEKLGLPTGDQPLGFVWREPGGGEHVAEFVDDLVGVEIIGAEGVIEGWVVFIPLSRDRN